MAWIESHQSLGTHRKLLKLRTLLKISDAQAVGHLHYLWWWCLDNAMNGDLGSLCNEIIAEAAHWRIDSDSFVSAMIESGFLEINEGKLCVHDWKTFTDKLVEGRRKAKERMQARRERERTLRERSANVTGTFATTVPYHTVPKEKEKKSDNGVNGYETVTPINVEALNQLREAAGIKT